MTKLVFIGAEGAPEVPIPPAGVTFGRAPDCDLPIQEGSVSGHHGSLRFEGGRWWLHDNNSSNGSFVNGQRIADSPLNNGDTLQFGEAAATAKTGNAEDKGAEAVEYSIIGKSTNTVPNEYSVPELSPFEPVTVKGTIKNLTLTIEASAPAAAPGE